MLGERTLSARTNLLLSTLILVALIPIGQMVRPAATLSRRSCITLQPEENYPASAVMDPNGQYAYFGTYTTPGTVVKIRLSDFSRVGAITLQTGESCLTSAVIDPNGQYAYFGGHVSYGSSSESGRIVKIRLSDFSRVDTLVLPGGLGFKAAVMDPHGQYAYFFSQGIWLSQVTVPWAITKIRLSDFTPVGTLQVSTGETDIYAAVIDPNGQYAYFSCTHYASGLRIVKIRLSDLTRVGTMSAVGRYAAVMDPNGQYAYFGTYESLTDPYSSSPSQIHRIRLSNFTYVGAKTLPEGEDYLRSAVIDPNGRYAYFGTDTSPGRVVKIRLSDFSRAGAITLQEGENSLRCAVINPDGEKAYFAAYTAPGKIVEIALNGIGLWTLGDAASKVLTGGATLKYLYPWTTLEGKLPGLFAADWSDTYAAAGALQGAGGGGYRQGWDTDATKVSLSNGWPLLTWASSGDCIVLTGGPDVHNSIRYYMDLAPAGADQSPAYCRIQTVGGITYYQFVMRSTGAVIASVPTLEVGVGMETTQVRRDLALVQTFTDANGRVIAIVTGVTLKGTQAGALWFAKKVMANPSAYVGSVYVVAWNDSPIPWTVGGTTIPAGTNDTFVDLEEIQEVFTQE